MRRVKRFQNLEPQPDHGLRDVLRWQLGGGPAEAPFIAPGRLPPYQPARDTPGDLTKPPAGRIQLTWIGHSTFLIQLGGRNVLTDPIFGNCQPPLPLSRLRRVAPPGLPMAALPPIHDVLISHCHYDHLDAPTIRQLGGGPNYWVPEGLAAWFHRRKLRNCRELAWGQSARMADGLELHCVPAQHFAARGLLDRDRTHWCGWVLHGPERTVYFAGDTGYGPGFREIGERFGGFDLALIPIGAYRPRWIMRPVHVDPEEAVQIHEEVRSRLSVGCHWGTFRLTDEPLNEPPVVLRQSMEKRGLAADQFRVLKFGETICV